MTGDPTTAQAARESAMRDVWRSVTELFFSAENQAKFAGAAVELGVTPPMLRALLDFEPDEAVPMRSLATQWQCDPSFVTVVVDGLEKPGFVERRVATHDRRVKTVQLTDAGEAARERALEAVYAAPTAFWELRADEQETLARLLRKLADAQAVYDALILDRGEGACGPPPVLRVGVERQGEPVLSAEASRPVDAPGPPDEADATGSSVLGRGRPARGGRTRLGPARFAGGPLRGRGAVPPPGTPGSGGTEPEYRGEVASGEALGWRAHFEAHQQELRQLRDELARVRDEVRAQARRPLDEVRAAKADLKAEVQAVKADVKAEARAAVDDAKAHLKGDRRRR